MRYKRADAIWTLFKNNIMQVIEMVTTTELSKKYHMGSIEITKVTDSYLTNADGDLIFNKIRKVFKKGFSLLNSQLKAII